MAKPVIISLNGETASFGIRKLSRSQLYGSRKRVPTDNSGKPCDTAALDVETGMTLLSGMTAQGYFASDGRWIPSAELEAYDEQGAALAPVESTLGVAQEAAPVGAEEVLDIKISSVYLADPEDVSDGILNDLKAGKILTFSFNYRSDYQAERAFLLGNQEGVFILVGQPALTEWAQFDAARIMGSVVEEEEDEELDFDMF